jgi:two-component system, chemotaxis family, protein-glutamate methylesterase/glutaminase
MGEQTRRMSMQRIVVIGTSSGGLEALRVLVSTLPADFNAPICIVMHTAPQSPGVLGSILTRAGALPAAHARDGERLQPARIYVAPPDFHLVVEPGRVRVSRGPRENRFRPAIDPLFRSAAQVYGPGAIGVILTGNLDDGVAGLWAIKQLGGVAIVQQPEDALFPSLPRHAVRHVAADHIVPLTSIASVLTLVVAEPEKPIEAQPAPESLEVEVDIAKDNRSRTEEWVEIAEPSTFACPECHGVLLQLKEGQRIRFRCHTGHAFSPDSLLTAISEGTEAVLWNAIRALEEGALLIDRMVRHVKDQHDGEDAERLSQRSCEARRQAEVLRGLVSSPETVTSDV